MQQPISSMSSVLDAVQPPISSQLVGWIMCINYKCNDGTCQVRRDKAVLDTWDSLSLDNRQPLEAGTVSASHTLTGLSQVRNIFMEARIQTHFAKICFIFSVFSFI